MLLSAKQVPEFWRLWSQACRVQGWTAEHGFSAVQINAERKALLARCGFNSLTEVDRLAGFTRVKHELLLLISDHTNLESARETEDPLLNKARVWRWVIVNEILPCLGLYEENPRGYLQRVMADKNRWWKIDRPESEITLDDLDAKPVYRHKDGELKEYPSTLEQLMMTLNARLHEKRSAAGHSVHAMKIEAEVKCTCAVCAQDRATRVAVPALDDVTAAAEVLQSEDPDWTV